MRCDAAIRVNADAASEAYRHPRLGGSQGRTHRNPAISPVQLQQTAGQQGLLIAPQTGLCHGGSHHLRSIPSPRLRLAGEMEPALGPGAPPQGDSHQQRTGENPPEGFLGAVQKRRSRRRNNGKRRDDRNIHRFRAVRYRRLIRINADRCKQRLQRRPVSPGSVQTRARPPPHPQYGIHSIHTRPRACVPGSAMPPRPRGPATSRAGMPIFRSNTVTTAFNTSQSPRPSRSTNSSQPRFGFPE